MKMYNPCKGKGNKNIEVKFNTDDITAYVAQKYGNINKENVHEFTGNVDVEED